MTRKFNVLYTCQHCGQRTTAETGFGRWMRNNPALDSGRGIVRTDTDHTVLRYKTHKQGRDFQLIMDVEVKEYGSEPDPAQKDILIFKHLMITNNSRNRCGAKTDVTYKLKSPMLRRKVRVRYLGTHLLQFEKTNPNDSTWIKWDRKEISAETLTGLLALEFHPNYPDRPMDEFLRDRHEQCVFDGWLIATPEQDS